jgi:hypothetical protein
VIRLGYCAAIPLCPWCFPRSALAAQQREKLPLRGRMTNTTVNRHETAIYHV